VLATDEIRQNVLERLLDGFAFATTVNDLKGLDALTVCSNTNHLLLAVFPT
jgi:hypothetical protein